MTIPIHPRFLKRDNSEIKKVPKKNIAKTFEHRKKIINYMTNDVWFKASEINEVIEVGSRRLRAILNDMVLDGILEVDGQTKGKKYRIKDKENVSSNRVEERR